MPNVTYIIFKSWPNYSYSFTNNSMTTTMTTINNNLTSNSTINFPSNVILLIEEQNEKLFNGNKYAMALMISALLLILIGCCCACNWFNQNTKIRTIIPRNKNILLGHGKTINSRPRRRIRDRNNRYTTGINGINYNDVVINDAECNNNNSISGLSAQQVGRNMNTVNDDNYYDVESGNEDRTNPSADQPDVLRRYDLDVESLPSYTLCSGLPSYDSALEEFRKAGIILTTTPSIVKIFENTSKEHQIGGSIFDNNDLPVSASPTASSSTTYNTNITDTNLNSSCNCGGSSPSIGLGDGNFENNPSPKLSRSIESIIELSPEQLNMLSEKRLSLQIAFNSSIRQIQPSNRGIDLRREVLRSHEIPAAIHRSSSLRLIPRSNDDTRLPSPKLLHLNMHRHRGSIV